MLKNKFIFNFNHYYIIVFINTKKDMLFLQSFLLITFRRNHGYVPF
ncbi:hypothetical protein SYNTR_0024 [Candidatus Syntrophocurvum alkaliphilum]|uniref:Uncharacterized protein n=1 Tax=Candidatus Syntrophocurvum alkaliphilum TaxID=2293317 RepID=A0A6I6D7I4_9FIRM|nr:hypothetical protein SYNTR_0024 [Candidatus Syntrophocurvum alkaliphilum]